MPCLRTSEARVAPSDAFVFIAILGGLKPCLSSWKSAQADCVRKPEGLPRTERAALAPLFELQSIARWIRKTRSSQRSTKLSSSAWDAASSSCAASSHGLRTSFKTCPSHHLNPHKLHQQPKPPILKFSNSQRHHPLPPKLFLPPPSQTSTTPRRQAKLFSPATSNRLTRSA